MDVSPGLLLGLDQPDHVLHPQHQVPDHAEEPELVSSVHQLHPPALHRLQEVLPGLQDLEGQDTTEFRSDRSSPENAGLRSDDRLNPPGGLSSEQNSRKQINEIEAKQKTSTQAEAST